MRAPSLLSRAFILSRTGTDSSCRNASTADLVLSADYFGPMMEEASIDEMQVVIDWRTLSSMGPVC